MSFGGNRLEPMKVWSRRYLDGQEGRVAWRDEWGQFLVIVRGAPGQSSPMPSDAEFGIPVQSLAEAKAMADQLAGHPAADSEWIGPHSLEQLKQLRHSSSFSFGGNG
jgi:hypothetical protein